MKLALGLCFALLLAGCATWQSNPSPEGQGVSFAKFYRDLERDSAARGLDVAVLRASYDGVKPAPLKSLVAKESGQKEFTGTLSGYMGRAVNAAKVAKGREMLRVYRKDLQKVKDQYAVPPELIVALWGMESDYGRHQGTTPVLPALVSLAYHSPRAEMFRNEVFAALQLPNAATLKGSWAGASGHCQFMPSNILKHATDGNGDGKVDIWNTEADAFASTAAFLRHLGYVPGQPWRWRLKTPPSLSGIVVNERGLSEPLPWKEWQARGAKLNARLPNTTAVRYYRSEANGPAYFVGPNYEAVLGWNYSSFFATSVFTLAERIGE